MIPKPKYDIGDLVFVGTSEYRTELITCPSCLGSRACKVTASSGDEWDAPCGECTDGWTATGKKKVHAHMPLVRRLTIGSIRIDTEDKTPVTYMALETGVGSGTLWDEADMSPDYETAMSVAQARSAKANADLNERERASAELRRKQAVRKPSYEQRRIKDLENELKAIKQRKAAE